MYKRDVDPFCDTTGRCVASIEDRPLGVSSCILCGKRLVLGPEGWLTWDHDQYSDPRVQDEE